MPYIDRGHSTYGAATNPIDADQLSGSTVKGLGDVRFIVSYQGLLEDDSLGFQLGVKAPSGRYGGPSADGTGVVGRRSHRVLVGARRRNASPDNLVDTSLQPGTGSTDLIVSTYYHRFVSDNLNAFVNGQFQAASRTGSTSPARISVPATRRRSASACAMARPDIVPQLQVNFLRKGRDQGALADNPNSASTIVYLAPA